jgi:hypothetical protein
MIFTTAIWRRVVGKYKRGFEKKESIKENCGEHNLMLDHPNVYLINAKKSKKACHPIGGKKL